MSLLWPERLTLLIHPQRVLLERRDFRGRVACEVATALPVSEIAYALGYQNASSFNRQFKRRFGLTPSEFRAASRSR